MRRVVVRFLEEIENTKKPFRKYLTFSRDEFELEFSGSSEPELWMYQAESSRAGALQFSS